MARGDGRLLSFEVDGEGELAVDPRCHCGRFLKRGAVLVNKLGDTKLVEWTCKLHGEVQPRDWYWA